MQRRWLPNRSFTGAESQPIDSPKADHSVSGETTGQAMARLDKCYNIADLREVARRRLPKGVFDYID